MAATKSGQSLRMGNLRPLIDFDGLTFDPADQRAYFERYDCEESLYAFTRTAWRHIDPAPFRPGWPIQAICEHLEAVADGDIKRLIINIPPRSGKPVSATALVTTMRGLVRLGDVEVGDYVLTHRGRFRQVREVHRQGVLAVNRLTTRRGRQVTAAPDHPFLTPQGWRELGDLALDDVIGIVPNLEPGIGCATLSAERARLLGYLVGDGCCRGTANITVSDDIEAADIDVCIRAAGFVPSLQTYRMKLTGCLLQRITLTSGAPKGTLSGIGPVRRFLTEHGLWGMDSYSKHIPPSVLAGSDEVVANFVGAYWACDGYVTSKGAKRDGTARDDLVIGCDSVNETFIRQMQALLLRLGVDSIVKRKVANIRTKRQGETYTSWRLTLSDQDNCWRFAERITIPHSKGVKLEPARRRRFDFDRSLIGDVVERNEPVGEAECVCLTVNEDESFVADGFAVHNSTLCSVCYPAWTWAQPHDSATSGPGAQFVYASYAEKLALRFSLRNRRLIASSWYQQHWSERFRLLTDENTAHRFANDQGGERLVTSISGTATGFGGNIFVIDDANAANEAFSEAKIEEVIEWWDQTASTRLNDLDAGAYVIIQQRLAENDLTGHVLEQSIGDWDLLALPMHFDPDRVFITSIGWRDPRAREGELLWPERFPEKAVRALEATLGPFACTPAEAPVLMADLTMKPISEVKAGDVVMGFDKRERRDGRQRRFKLTPSKVKETHRYEGAAINKLILDSGETIRCTPDHRWFTKDRTSMGREMYLPAMTRSRLARVCPARLPELSVEDARDAGWLGGFFDGEGSVSSCQQRNGFKPSNAISLYQGAGRNLPNCEKLERVLTKFGFEFSVREDERKPNKDAPCYGYRTYRILQGDGCETVQRFLHIAQPTKWRERLIEGCYRSNFIKGREKVLSIQPDGVGDVYALTTETGNYVVWGLASSNSAGQLEQSPKPKGGGVVKYDWWNAWEAASYPPMDFILASLDTAYTEKTENDYSAMTVWGVFSYDVVGVPGRIIGRDGRPQYLGERNFAEESPRVMLMHAWQARLPLHELVMRVAETCRKMKVDTLLIENKASGISTAQEMQRLYGHEKWSVELNDPKGIDKLARLHSVVPLFAPELTEKRDPQGRILRDQDGRPILVPTRDGIVYAPSAPGMPTFRIWAEEVCRQVESFPHGAHDDLVDTVSQALRKLRDMGLLTLPVERLAEVEAMKQYSRPPEPLYPGV